MLRAEREFRQMQTKEQSNIKPRRLKTGDTIAVLSPSWGGAFLFPHIFEDGIDVLKNDFGFKIKEFPTTRMSPKELHENPQKRAEDLNDAFKDESISGIICSIGGDDSIRILKYLDIEAIKNNPKLIMGYSDSTTILCYLNLHGLVTYYGSSIMGGFSYIRCFPEALAEYKEVLLSGHCNEIKPFTEWTDGYKNWGEIGNRGKVNEIRKDDIGHRWINRGKISSGQLWGGCIEVLDMMNGTLAWPEIEFWDSRILMIETSEGKPTPRQIGFILRNFGVQGILARIKGLIVAKARSYSQEEKTELDQVIIKIVIGEFMCNELNILTNVDFGHTDPRHILPLGISLELNPTTDRITFVESLFS